MSVPTGPIQVGATFDVTGTAEDASGATVPSATVSWESSDPAGLSVTDNGSSNGVGSAVYTAVAPGTYTGTGVATNSDGSTVNTGPGDPFSVTVEAPVATQLAVS